MRNLFNTLWRSDGLRSTSLVVTGNGIAQGLSGITLIVLSRLLPLEEYGIFSAGFALAMILVPVAEAGLTPVLIRAVPRTLFNSGINKLFSSTLKIKLAISLVMMVIGCLASAFIAKLLGVNSQLLPIVVFTTLPIIVLFNQQSAMLQSLLLFKQAVSMNILQATLKLFLGIGVWFFAITSGLWSLLFYLAIPIFGLLFTPKLFPQWLKLQLRSAKLEIPTKYRALATNTYIAGVGAAVIANVDVLMVQRYLSTEDAAVIGAVSRVALFVLVIGYSIGAVLNARVARYSKTQDLENFLRKACLLSVLVLGVGLLSLLGTEIFTTLILGPTYLPGLPLFNWLMISSTLFIITSVFGAVFYSLHFPKYFSIAAVSQSIILIVGNRILLPTYGLVAAGWVRTFAQAVVLLITLVLALTLFRQQHRRLPRLLPQSQG